ncbi:MAG: cation:proton antiporter [Cyanobacteria bacterium P01_D01_bin.73]
MTDLVLTAIAPGWAQFLSPPSLPFTSFLAEASADAEAGPFVLAGVLLSLIVVYLASKIGGELCVRLDLPPVLGELVGGVVVGVSVLNLLVFPEEGAAAIATDSRLMGFLQATAGVDPDIMGSVFASTSETVNVLSEIGVILLLFEIGLESDLNELIRVGPQAAIVAVVGVVTPFLLGTGGLVYFFNLDTVPAIFAGAALTATSIGITAKVLAEIQRLSSREGQIIIGAAVLDDILGIVILAVVASLAKEGTVEISNVLILVASAAAFLIGVIVLGRLLIPYFVGLMDQLKTRGQVLILSLTLAFALAYVADVIQLEGILGAFAAGLVLAETKKRDELEEQVKPVADVLVPVFFVAVGAKTNLGVLNPAVPANREGLIIAAFLIAVAIVGKVVTGYTLFGGKEKVNKLAIGVGMIPRGEVGLVFAGVGSASGVLPESLDAAIIVMVIATTFLAPPMLRFAFNMGGPSDAEPVAETSGG